MQNLVTHGGEKPFKRDICNSESTRKQQLEHLLTHSGEKPFKYEICDYASTQKQYLVTPMRIHCVEKPFKTFGDP